MGAAARVRVCVCAATLPLRPAGKTLGRFPPKVFLRGRVGRTAGHPRRMSTGAGDGSRGAECSSPRSCSTAPGLFIRLPCRWQRAVSPGHTALLSIEAFVLLHRRCLIPIIAISIKVQRKVKREKSLLSPKFPGSAQRRARAGGGRGLPALVSGRIWHREGAGEGGPPPQLGSAGVAAHRASPTLLASVLRAPRGRSALCWPRWDPPAVPQHPQIPGKLLRAQHQPRLHLCAHPQLCQQRVHSAAELAWEGPMLPLLQVSPKTSLGSSFPLFPTRFGWSEARRPPLPAALNFGCHAGEQRVTQMSPLPAVAAWRWPSPVLYSPAPSEVSFPVSRSPPSLAGPAQPGSLAVTSSSRCSTAAVIRLHRRTRSGPAFLAVPAPLGSPSFVTLRGFWGFSGLESGGLCPGARVDAVGAWSHHPGATTRSYTQAPAQGASLLHVTGDQMSKNPSPPPPLLLPLLLLLGLRDPGCGHRARGSAQVPAQPCRVLAPAPPPSRESGGKQELLKDLMVPQSVCEWGEDTTMLCRGLSTVHHSGVHLCPLPSGASAGLRRCRQGHVLRWGLQPGHRGGDGVGGCHPSQGTHATPQGFARPGNFWAAPRRREREGEESCRNGAGLLPAPLGNTGS